MWNLLTARAVESQLAAGVAIGVGAVAFAPVAALTWRGDLGAVWPYAVGSVALELLYLVALATAYQRAPLSVVYPVARGAAPVIVLAVSVLALGVSLAAGAAAGVLLVAGGVLLVRGSVRDGRGTALGLAIATCIAGYTLVDNAPLPHAPPGPYLAPPPPPGWPVPSRGLVLAPAAAIYLAAAAVLRGGRVLAAEVRGPTIVAGLGMFGAYALALAALVRAEAAPVAAVRESSVVIATALAAVVLHERVDRRRWLGAVLVVAGVAAIALAG